MTKTKMDYAIEIQENYDNRGEFIVIMLNGELNSAIPMTSPRLQEEKVEKLNEVKLYNTSVEGIEFLM